MVSAVPYRSFKELDLRHSYRVLVAIVIGLVVLLQEPEIMLFAIGIFYVPPGRSSGLAPRDRSPARTNPGADRDRRAAGDVGMSEIVRIFDTTLRDGEQSPGCSMNLAEKLTLARQLERLGVDVIEAGFPDRERRDFEAVRAIAREIRSTSICGLARTGRQDVERADKRSKAPRSRASTPSSRPATSTSSTSCA